jgi:CRP-like cAMP-binding protein
MDGEPVIPAPLDDDDDDVAWALQTAAVQWQRGARADAVVWVRRAVDAAIAAGNAARTQDLTRLAASVADRLVVEAMAAPDSQAPPRMSERGGEDVDDLLTGDHPRKVEPSRPRPTAHSLTNEIPVEFEDDDDVEEVEEIEDDDDDQIATIPPPSLREAPTREREEDLDADLKSEPYGFESSSPLDTPDDVFDGPRSMEVGEDDLFSAPPGPLSRPAHLVTAEDLFSAPPGPHSMTEPPVGEDELFNAPSGHPSGAPLDADDLFGAPPPGPEGLSIAPIAEPSAPPPPSRSASRASPLPAESFSLPPALNPDGAFGAPRAPLTAPKSPSFELDLAPPSSPPGPELEAALEEPPTLEHVVPSVPAAAPSEPAPAGAATTVVDGVALEEVRGFEDLPEEAQCRLAASAVLTSLSADEEVGTFGAALVTRGRVGIMPAIADVAVSVASVGEVVFTRGTLDESVSLRVVALEDDTVVASWSSEELAATLADCPWVGDELRLVADRFQALAGATLGPLGDRLDDSLRGQVLSRLDVKSFAPGEVIVTRGKPIPGLFIVGAGRVDLLEGDAVSGEASPGDFLFATEVLAAGAAPMTARAGKGGALLLWSSRSVAHELMMSVPPLLEILAT